MPGKSKGIVEALDRIARVLEGQTTGEATQRDLSAGGLSTCCYDYICGELILCFPKVDPAAKQLIEDIIEGRIEGVSHVESLECKLAGLELELDEALEFELHRVRVHVGEELWKITYLQFFYKVKLIEALSGGQERQLTPEFLASLGRSDFQFTVVPNSVISLAAKPHGKAGVSARDFTFSQFHQQYKAILGIPAVPAPGLDQVTIAVIDSGIADDAQALGITIAETKNLVETIEADEDGNVKPPVNWQVTDENGHGTVIAMILHDVAPGARLLVYKVADAEGRVSEWDAVAAMAVCSRADVVNLSLAFGLKGRFCKVCGRESHSSRSAVFENMIRQFASRGYKSILIAAAGNKSERALAFPARFGEVVAIGAINSNGELSYESNYGNQYTALGTPDNHFVCPGGDEGTDPHEVIGSFGTGDDWHGTSFAAAYASGVVANLIAQHANEAAPATILKELRDNVDKKMVGKDPIKYGHGIMRLTT